MEKIREASNIVVLGLIPTSYFVDTVIRCVFLFFWVNAMPCSDFENSGPNRRGLLFFNKTRPGGVELQCKAIHM